MSSVALQVIQGGETKVFPFDRFARVGSSQECQVQISDAAFPAHALMVVLEEGKNFCRVVVKHDGLIVDGQPAKKESSFTLEPGKAVRVQAISLTLVAFTAPRASVVQPVQQHVLPGVINSNLPPIPLDNKTLENSGGSRAATGMNPLLVLLGLLVLLIGVCGWIVSQKSQEVQDSIEEQQISTFAEMIETMLASGEEGAFSYEWPLSSVIGREQVVEQLRYCFALEAKGRTSEAKELLQKMQLELQKDVPKDEKGHFKVRELAQANESEESSVASGNANGGVALHQSVGGLWFENNLQATLYDFLARKSADLDTE